MTVILLVRLYFHKFVKQNIFKMAYILLYRHVLKYLSNKAIESIKLVATVFIDKQNIVSVHCFIVYYLYLCCFELFEMSPFGRQVNKQCHNAYHCATQENK